MKYRVTHKTLYSYAELTPVCHNLVHLAPRVTEQQDCDQFELKVGPSPAFRVHRFDSFGNRVDYFSIEVPHDRLEITSESFVEVQPRTPEADKKSAPWEQCTMRGRSAKALAPTNGELNAIEYEFFFPTARVPMLAQLREYASKSFPAGRPIAEAIVDLTSRIHHDYVFDARATTVDTPLVDVLRLRRGVCQDFAHLATGCLRSLGLAARYTSGYLRTLPPPGKQRLVGADASHAWCSCWCADLGWIDFDPTNDCLAGDSYVTVAWGRDYGDVCPIQGVFVGQGEHRIGVSVDVAPV